MNDFDPMTDLSPPRSECEEAQNALQRLLDGEVTWDSTLAAEHRLACVDCREELTLARDMAAQLGNARSLSSAVVVPAELGSRIWQASLADRRRRQIVRLLGAGAALAASIMLAVVWLPPTEQHVRIVQTKNTTIASATPPKPLRDSVGEARDAMLAFTMRTAGETREQSVRLLPKLPAPPEPMTVKFDEPLADAQAGAAKSIKPLAVSAKRAMNLFLKTDQPLKVN